MSKDMLKRVQTLQRYMDAIQDGDIETVATLLEYAEQDRALENMLLEVNASYQYTDSTPVQKNDIVQAQQLMCTLAQQTTRRDAMQSPLFHTEDDSIQTPTIVVTEQSQSADQVSPGRNVLTPAFTARGTAKQKWYRSRKSWIMALAVAILAFFVLIQSNSTFASQLLSFFYVQQIKPVRMKVVTTPEKYLSIEGLGSFTASNVTTQINLTKAQVTHAITFPLMLPRQLPTNVMGVRPFFEVESSVRETFTFNVAKAHAYLAKNGYENVSIPTNLDGATFRMGRSTSVVVYYKNGRNLLGLTEMPVDEIQATGKASLQNLRDFLLSLPGLTPLVKEQLMQKNGDLLLPVSPATQIKPVTVHNVSGFLLNDKTTKRLSVMWEENGVEYSVGGINVNEGQLLATANSL